MNDDVPCERCGKDRPACPLNGRVDCPHCGFTIINPTSPAGFIRSVGDLGLVSLEDCEETE